VVRISSSRMEILYGHMRSPQIDKRYIMGPCCSYIQSMLYRLSEGDKELIDTHRVLSTHRMIRVLYIQRPLAEQTFEEFCTF